MIPRVVRYAVVGSLLVSLFSIFAPPPTLAGPTPSPPPCGTPVVGYDQAFFQISVDGQSRGSSVSLASSDGKDLILPVSILDPKVVLPSAALHPLPDGSCGFSIQAIPSGNFSFASDGTLEVGVPGRYVGSDSVSSSSAPRPSRSMLIQPATRLDWTAALDDLGLVGASQTIAVPVGAAYLRGYLVEARDQALRSQFALAYDSPWSERSIRIGQTSAVLGLAAGSEPIIGYANRQDLSLDPYDYVGARADLSQDVPFSGTVEIFVDGRSLGKYPVAAGIISATAPLPATGSSQVRFVFTDQLGNQIVRTATYYATSGLVQGGRSDLDFYAGVSDPTGTGLPPHPVVALDRYVGLSPRLTLRENASYNEDGLQFGAGFTTASSFGGLTAGVEESGGHLGLSDLYDFERPSYGFSATYALARPSVLEVLDALNGAQRSLDIEGHVLIARVSIQGDVRRYFEPSSRVVDRVASVTAPIGRITGTFRLEETHALTRSIGQSQHQASFYVSLPSTGRLNASAEAASSQKPVVVANDPPPLAGGLGFSSSSALGGPSSIRASAVLPFMQADLSSNFGLGSSSPTLDLSGSAAFVPGLLAFGRPSSGDVVLVHGEDAQGFDVKAAGLAQGRIDSHGDRILTNLQTGAVTVIEVSSSRFSLGAVSKPANVLVATRRGVASVLRLDRLRIVPYSGRIFNEQGRPLPLGTVHFVGRDGWSADAPLDDEGNFYVESPRDGSFSVRTSSGVCRGRVDWPPAKRIVTDVGKLFCRL